jgi:hypothetical protein
MSAYVYLTADQLITTLPCRLYSVTVTPDAAAVADVVLYDGEGAETGHEIATLRTASGATLQARYEGLQLSRGLYVDIGSNVTCCVVEWEPAK